MKEGSTRFTGQSAETLALEYLTSKGMTLLERNVTRRGAEIDLIMIDGDTWVFVEVRSREDCKYIHPFETITREKQLKVIRAATGYAVDAGCYHTRPLRFDAVAVSLSDNKIEWIKGAFG